MIPVSNPPIPREDWVKTLEHVADQTFELLNNDKSSVTCICGETIALFYAYRCLYCESLFCRNCAEEHFGQTVEDYRKENPVEDDADST